ncbi:Hypothetical predicted protein [Marmota monax]|uniref:Uncharacterized protein n=2 Tax=Marmota monax TaxID=9995 RepID=A0A5E4CJA0_MARMO|nr:Hypothetical predicted protein [Marmota monax]
MAISNRLGHLGASPKPPDVLQDNPSPTSVADMPVSPLSESSALASHTPQSALPRGPFWKPHVTRLSRATRQHGRVSTTGPLPGQRLPQAHPQARLLSVSGVFPNKTWSLSEVCWAGETPGLPTPALPLTPAGGCHCYPPQGKVQGIKGHKGRRAHGA